MRFRTGRGRTPDPTKPGTVYRAGPGWRLHRNKTGLTPTVGPQQLADPRLPDAVSPDPWVAPPPIARQPNRPAPPMRRRRRIWPWLVTALVTLLVVYPLTLSWVAWSNITKVDATVAGGTPSDGTTYLVVGTDRREGMSRDETARLRVGSSKIAGIRTDTLMLLHTSSAGTVLVSIPRDSYVSIPGHGKNKINSAYSMSSGNGPQLLTQTVQEATGLHIDHYVETGFAGYATIVDALGGINICVKHDLKDEKAHIDLSQGCQTMDGVTALGYARARYGDPLGDLGRVQRQRQVLAAIAGSALSPSLLAQPWKAYPVAKAGGQALTVDATMHPWQLPSFLLAMRKASSSDAVSLTVPVADAALPTPAGEAVKWDSAQAQHMFNAIARNDMTTLHSMAKMK